MAYCKSPRIAGKTTELLEYWCQVISLQHKIISNKREKSKCAHVQFFAAADSFAFKKIRNIHGYSVHVMPGTDSTVSTALGQFSMWLAARILLDHTPVRLKTS